MERKHLRELRQSKNGVYPYYLAVTLQFNSPDALTSQNNTKHNRYFNFGTTH